MKKNSNTPCKKPPTLQELQESDKDVLNCYEISGVLHSTPYQLNLQARSDAEKGTRYLPFPTIVVGTRVKIPRVPFIKFMGGDPT